MTRVLLENAIGTTLCFYVFLGCSMSEKLLRLWDILGDKKQGIPPIIPISRSVWYKGVREGRFPAPIKFGERTSLWRESDIVKLLNSYVDPRGNSEPPT